MSEAADIDVFIRRAAQGFGVKVHFWTGLIRSLDELQQKLTGMMGNTREVPEHHPNMLADVAANANRNPVKHSCPPPSLGTAAG